MRTTASIIGLALATSASIARADVAAPPAAYSADGRAVAGFFLNYATKGGVPSADASEVLASFDRALSEDTGLVRARLPENYAARCTARFTELDLCVLQTLFPELDAVERPDAVLPTPEVAAKRVAAQRDQPQIVFNLSVAVFDGQRQATFRVFSSTTAAAVVVRAQLEARAKGRSLDAFELQSVLQNEAVRRISLQEQDSLSDRRFYRDVFSRVAPLLAMFPRTGSVFVPGDGVPEGAQLVLDGETLGPIGESGARISDVRIGRRALEVRAEGYLPVRFELEVPASAEVAAAPFALSSVAGTQVRTWVRTGVMVTGAAVAVTGVAALVYSGLNSRGICYGETLDDCPSAGYGSSGLPTVGDSVSLERGFPVFPLGLGLVSAGATWGLGTWLTTLEDEVPWLPLVVGLAVGGATFGATWALQP